MTVSIYIVIFEGHVIEHSDTLQVQYTKRFINYSYVIHTSGSVGCI